MSWLKNIHRWHWVPTGWKLFYSLIREQSAFGRQSFAFREQVTNRKDKEGQTSASTSIDLFSMPFSFPQYKPIWPNYLRYVVKNNTGLFGNFSQHGGGGESLPNSQNFCKFTKSFSVCPIHFEVLKHVLHTGGGNIWSILSPKVHLIWSLRRSFREENENK